MKQIIIYTLLSLALASVPAYADLVVNEVMVNEPGNSASLEWIEIYTESTRLISTNLLEIRVNNIGIFVNAGSVTIDDFLIICKDTIRFEEHWGDSSGSWGDSPIENGKIVELNFSRLLDNSGMVELFYVQETSRLSWWVSGLNGHSWERVEPLSLAIEQSVDPTGSTPGRINSHTKVPHDLALTDITVKSDAGTTILEFTIFNQGTTEITDALLHLHYLDVNEPDSLGQLIGSEPVGPIDTGYTVILKGQFEFAGLYLQLVAKLDDDDRDLNNKVSFTAPGDQYPPVILSEFLANPTRTPGGEWVEVKNISGSIIDLAEWQLGDSTRLTTLASTPLIMLPGAYLVLCENTIVFLNSYPSLSATLQQVTPWRTLNNDGDRLRLVDPYDIEAGFFIYADVFDSNYTWSRGEAAGHRDDWGSSSQPGGSPGEPNEVRFSSVGNLGLEISVQPQIFSPDGDGYDDSTIIVLTPPEADSYDLKIYDAQGRRVKTFEDGVANLLGQYVWRGDDDAGRKLPVGIYILYFEAAGVESIKKTIVIAR